MDLFASLEQSAAPTAADVADSTGLELLLLRLRYREGGLRPLEGNNPLLLDDPVDAWVVYTGRVEVFAVRVQPDGGLGPRRHLFGVGVGGILFGVEPAAEEGGAVLLAVGVPGTQVLRVAPAGIQALASDIEFAAPVAGMIDAWLLGLSAALGGELAPKNARPVRPEPRLRLAVGDALLPAQGLLWLRLLSGELHYGSAAGAKLAADDAIWLPISAGAWVQAGSASEIEIVNSAGFIERDTEWASLAPFHRRALAAVRANLERDDLSQARWIADTTAAQRQLLERAMLDTRSVLDGAATETVVNIGGEEPLLAACRLVGAAMGIVVQGPAGATGGADSALQRIAAATGMRTREVALAAGWWRRDNGPLLGVLAQGEHPVALLPGRGGYELADPAAGRRVPVTASVAAELQEGAYTFYRPFPAGPVGLRTLLGFGLRGSRADLWRVVGAGIATGLLALLPPLAVGYLFDQAIPRGEYGDLVVVGLVLLVLAAAAALFGIVRGIAVLRVEGRLDSSLQAALWDRLLNLPATFFRNYSAGDLGTRAMGISTIRQMLSGPALNSLLVAIFSVFSFALLLSYHLGLGLLAGGLVLLSVAVTTASGLRQVAAQRKLAGLQGRVAGLVLQLLHGVPKFQVAGAEEQAFALWAREFNAQRRLAFYARRLVVNLATFNGAYPILTAIIIFAGVAALARHDFSVGAFLAFNTAFAQLLGAGLQLSNSVTAILGIVPVYERAKPILQQAAEFDPSKVHPGELSGGIEVDHVSFRYKEGGPLVLHDVSLKIEPGQFVALVGPSGSGKSTLFRLLLGFERPETGVVYYDGQDLAGLDQRGVRQQIGVVLQQGKLMSGILLQNIIGSSLLTIDDAWEAARLAGLEADIRRMPMGMYTVVPEGATTLSGGQRQRLLIARALVRKPRIVFFDEATSALDNQTQSIVSKSLEGLNATRVVVAHRLSTIVGAQRIYVLENGRIVQSGTYQELVAQPGLFAELAKRQLG